MVTWTNGNIMNSNSEIKERMVPGMVSPWSKCIPNSSTSMTFIIVMKAKKKILPCTQHCVTIKINSIGIYV